MQQCTLSRESQLANFGYHSNRREVPECWFPKTLIFTNVSFLLSILVNTFMCKDWAVAEIEGEQVQAACEGNLSGDERLNVSYWSLTWVCHAASNQGSDHQGILPPFTSNVVLYEPVLYIPIKKFNFDESVRKCPSHCTINHVKKFITITALIYFFVFFFLFNPCNADMPSLWQEKLERESTPSQKTWLK